MKAHPVIIPPFHGINGNTGKHHETRRPKKRFVSLDMTICRSVRIMGRQCAAARRQEFQENEPRIPSKEGRSSGMRSSGGNNCFSSCTDEAHFPGVLPLARAKGDGCYSFSLCISMSFLAQLSATPELVESSPGIVAQLCSFIYSARSQLYSISAMSCSFFCVLLACWNW